MSEPAFKTEADLCAAFIAWANGHDGVRCFSEWWGWDILIVYPDGGQLGIQAKLRLNVEVLDQALPNPYSWECDWQGPDFRGVLVPAGSRAMQEIAEHLGLLVFSPASWRQGFTPELDGRHDPHHGWVDWNPTDRHDLPPTPTDAIAGSPCPVTLTHWKLAALDVLAELEVKGTITTKRMRELKVSPSRWLSGFWLEPAEERGNWVRGDRCPKFDEQHPTAYALALEKARAVAAVPTEATV